MHGCLRKCEENKRNKRNVTKFLVIIQDFTVLMKITFMCSFSNVKIKVIEFDINISLARVVETGLTNRNLILKLPLEVI